MRWIAISTDLLDWQHDLHPHRTGSPACEAFAWIDLIGLAAWKGTSDLRRGEVAASVRFLATRWNWGTKRTHGFLTALEEAGRIVWIRPGSGKREPGRVRICNYDRYQQTGNAKRNANDYANDYANDHANDHKDVQVPVQEENVGLRPTAKPSVENSRTANGSQNDESEKTEPTLYERLGPIARQLHPDRDEQNRWIAWAKRQRSVDTAEARMGGLVELRDRSALEWIPKGTPVKCRIYENPKTVPLMAQAEKAWHTYGPSRARAIMQELGVT